MIQYYPTDIIKKLQKIINNSNDKTLNPKTLYRNISNSTPNIKKLSIIFEVPETLINEIINANKLKSDMTVPNEIKNQLMVLGKNAVMCWGSHNFIGSGAIDPYHNGELIFSVINVKDIKKGYIRIQLRYDDLYNILIFDTMESTKPKYEIKGVYNDMLIGIIGDKIGY